MVKLKIQHREIIIGILSLVLLVSSACNFPYKAISKSTTRDPQFVKTLDALQLTLQAPDIHTQPTLEKPIEYDPSRFTAYYTQSGDTLNSVAAHFGIATDEISSAKPLEDHGLLSIGQQLIIPKRSEEPPYPSFLLPDSSVVNSVCGSAFDVENYVRGKDGKLATYFQEVNSNQLSGAEIVRLVSENTSVNPRVLLAFIEFRSGWVIGNSEKLGSIYPLGMEVSNYKGLYLELSLTAKLINMGYYGWRQGSQDELIFKGGGSVKIHPSLNAGSVGLQYLFARLYHQTSWNDALYSPHGFMAVYLNMFGDDDECARNNIPVFTDKVSAPVLELPFAIGERWVLTGGLHNDWNTGTPLGALDFAPVTGEPACTVSQAWVLASAPGVIRRSENGLVSIELLEENDNPTGWSVVLMHIAERDRISEGAYVRTNDRIGHPSCEGGGATGTHVHITRMFNGEWIGAGDPFPLVLSGWTAFPGARPYQSSLIKGDQVITANINGVGKSTIIR